jgi:hypothetical protein
LRKGFLGRSQQVEGGRASLEEVSKLRVLFENVHDTTWRWRGTQILVFGLRGTTFALTNNYWDYFFPKYN